MGMRIHSYPPLSSLSRSLTRSRQIPPNEWSFIWHHERCIGFCSKRNFDGYANIAADAWAHSPLIDMQAGERQEFWNLPVLLYFFLFFYFIWFFCFERVENFGDFHQFNGLRMVDEIDGPTFGLWGFFTVAFLFWWSIKICDKTHSEFLFFFANQRKYESTGFGLRIDVFSCWHYSTWISFFWTREVQNIAGACMLA